MESKYADYFKQLTILFVEDDTAIRENYTEFLSRYFGKVLTAENGEEGLIRYREYRPDIIITDITMPKLNGIDMAKEIRKEDKDVKIVIASAYTDTEYLLQAVEIYLVRFIVKPITPQVLFDALEKCAEEIRQERGLDALQKLGLDFYLDLGNQIVIHGDESMPLTKKEALFLELLCKNRTKVVTYEMIESYVWEDQYMSSEAIRTMVKKIRKKLHPDLIENISKTGYKLHQDSH